MEIEEGSCLEKKEELWWEQMSECQVQEVRLYYFLKVEFQIHMELK